LDQVFAKPVDDVRRLPMPHAVKQVALKIVDLNPSLPAPAFWKGVVEAWMVNKESRPAYALGHVRRGGFWYFYWLAVGVKTPLALLLLTSFGIALALFSSKRDWRIMAPAVSVLAILALAMVVKVNLGIRHILFIYPLMSLTAIGFSAFLWERRRLWPQLVALTLLGLFGWQIHCLLQRDRLTSQGRLSPVRLRSGLRSGPVATDSHSEGSRHNSSEHQTGNQRRLESHGSASISCTGTL